MTPNAFNTPKLDAVTGNIRTEPIFKPTPQDTQRHSLSNKELAEALLKPAPNQTFGGVKLMNFYEEATC